ncbi:hypothetical protein BC828DRAFT_405848 [Blastocladiella britannica]|nr:hypothetical protein BC828DRAFT_405848 [Blastocladiella britannica]
MPDHNYQDLPAAPAQDTDRPGWPRCDRLHVATAHRLDSFEIADIGLPAHLLFNSLDRDDIDDDDGHSHRAPIDKSPTIPPPLQQQQHQSAVRSGSTTSMARLKWVAEWMASRTTAAVGTGAVDEMDEMAASDRRRAADLDAMAPVPAWMAADERDVARRGWCKRRGGAGRDDDDDHSIASLGSSSSSTDPDAAAAPQQRSLAPPQPTPSSTRAVTAAAPHHRSPTVLLLAAAVVVAVLATAVALIVRLQASSPSLSVAVKVAPAGPFDDREGGKVKVRVGSARDRDDTAGAVAVNADWRQQPLLAAKLAPMSKIDIDNNKKSQHPSDRESKNDSEDAEASELAALRAHLQRMRAQIARLQSTDRLDSAHDALERDLRVLDSEVDKLAKSMAAGPAAAGAGGARDQGD